MTNPFIPQLVNKTTPVGNDLLIIADSQDSSNEKNTRISQVITNNKIVTEPSAITAGNIALGNTSNTLVDSGINVDHSQNMTNVGTINGISLPSLLVNSNNLSDVSNASVSFGHISPLSTKGDILGFASANTRVAIGTDTFVLTADSSKAVGFAWEPIPAGGGGYVDNAIFGGSAGTSLTGALTAVDLRLLIQNSPGNTWTVNLFTNLTCNTAGTYIFSGIVPVFSSGTTNLCYAKFAKNGTPVGPTGFVQLQNPGSGNIVIAGSIITCVVGDIITLLAESIAGYSVPSAGSAGSNVSSQVSIIRLQ